jgi:phosphatidate cytidylyltransferase
MASELKTRVITGFVFGVVLIGGILLSEYLLAAIAIFVLIVSIYEYSKMLKVINIHPNQFLIYTGSISVFSGIVAFTIAGTGVGANMDDVKLAAVGLISFLCILSIWELFRAKERAIENVGSTILGIAYLALPMGLLVASGVSSSGDYSPWQVLFFFFFMWASDTGAYFTGKAFGKTKLLERLSPKKTVEGFIGGMLTAMLVGYFASLVLGFGDVWAWLLIGAFMSITGTAGDLFESMLKRQTGVKDSGTILPGHGGFLDRFDSTFISAPVYWILLNFLTAS